MKKYSNVVIYDVCGTLYNSNTTFDFCKWRCKGKLWSLTLSMCNLKLFKIVNKIAENLFNIHLSRRLHLLSLKGVNKKILYEEASSFVDYFLKDKSITPIYNMILKDISDGNKVLLISASIDPVISAIAKSLNVEYISSSLEYIDDICSGNIDKDLLGSKDKLNIININKVVTDNTSDYELCKKSKYSVIVMNEKNKRFWSKNKIINGECFEL
ncbi:hypothetical protein C0W80_18325 [Photobacterium leiognathi subsp. mandapamensis]|uniref:haloacid dehalogenase-like hydrolase n=1 Tax=Photobacterium leiognathi TaxID=553611 RepID=UPI000D16E3E6|nr:haloacid dehalogenase-like hydrolase [Photobacterium leiognathi]PSU96066.1 hypothetical protein C0W80_18325 [Photobacterium leiognathi subsp. mandapamensis]